MAASAHDEALYLLLRTLDLPLDSNESVLKKKLTAAEHSAVTAVKYDVILSNPPYEPSAHCDALPAEFKQEPRMALDGGGDGLDIIRTLLRQARTRLQPHGIVLIEVGGLRAAMDREFAALDLSWLPTGDGSDCVCVVGAARLKTWRG